MPFENIYGPLLDAATLIPDHQQELITKRGFSDATIANAKLGSGGPHLTEFEDKFLKLLEQGEFREQDLVASGVFIPDGKRIRLNPILLRSKNTLEGKDISNILIPYLNENGNPYIIRPHKLGFKDIPSEIYQDLNLKEKPSEIILTEGEFKAIAGIQYGFPTIAVPGISSFSEKKFPDFIKKLNDHGVNRIIIMFDNETKDDPVFPSRFKENPHDRYDTQFYAYYMAQRLEKEAKEVLIAVLPDSWKIDGKIDIDGAAAQMKTLGEMKKVIYDALPRDEYLRSLPAEASQNVRRKMNQKYHRSKVKREFNRYVVTRQKGKTSWEEPISNFIIRIIATHSGSEGVRREAEFVNEIGKKSDTIMLTSDDMSSADSFRGFALNNGDYIWRGTTEDLLTIWESEFLMLQEGRYIREIDHLGWIDKEKLWMFGNIAIKDDGSEIRPDKNDIFWLEKKGVKIAPLNIAAGVHDVQGIPYIHTGGGFDALEFQKRMGETIGKSETNLLFGWISSVVFMEEIFEIYRSFPFLFVTGRAWSGKSTIAEWTANFFGIENAAKAISQTTPVAIQRSLAYYSCLPICLDEYRNTKDVVYKNGFLRTVYNRQSSGKGVKDSNHGLRDAKVRGTLILVGEETPKDAALLSRCIVIFVSKSKRQQNSFAWFQKNRLKFSGHIYKMLKDKPKNTTSFLKSLTEWQSFFNDKGIDDRTSINYATVVAGHNMVFGDDIEFADWLAGETKNVQGDHYEEQAVNVFMDDLLAIKTKNLINDEYWLEKDGKIYLYFHGLIQVWAQEYRKTRGDDAFKESSIRAYLKEEPGFISANTSFRIKGHMKKCVVFSAEKCSDDLKALVSEPIMLP